MATLHTASEARLAAETTLLNVHGDLLDKAAKKINEAALRGQFKASVFYGKEMTNSIREWLTEKLRASGYLVTSQYSNQYNEATYTFEISW